MKELFNFKSIWHEGSFRKKKTLSELNFDNEDGERDISVIKDGAKHPLTYLSETTDDEEEEE